MATMTQMSLVLKPAAARRTGRASRSSVRTFAAGNAGRELYYPGAKPPAYLDGTLAGDYGFDPLRLGANSASLPWFVEAERQNGRWAMLAVAGILVNDLAGLSEKWWVPDSSAHLDAAGFPTGRVAAEIAIMAAAEAARIAAFNKDGPGAKAFDPAGMKSDEAVLKEVKNGRLAMVAFLGFTSQAAVRGLGPLACLQAHLADPGHVNIFTSAVGGEAATAVAALSLAPLFLAAQKTLRGPNDKDEFRPIPW